MILEPNLRKVDELLHIGRRLRAIALQSAVGGMTLSLLRMAVTAAGYLPPVAGAIFQEVVDVLAVLNALRMAFPPRRRQLPRRVVRERLQVRRRIPRRRLPRLPRQAACPVVAVARRRTRTEGTGYCTSCQRTRRNSMSVSDRLINLYCNYITGNVPGGVRKGVFFPCWDRPCSEPEEGDSSGTVFGSGFKPDEVECDERFGDLMAISRKKPFEASLPVRAATENEPVE